MAMWYIRECMYRRINLLKGELGVKFGEFGGESFGKKKKEKVLKALEKRVLDISSFIYL